jgi:hypothetical protein
MDKEISNPEHLDENIFIIRRHQGLSPAFGIEKWGDSFLSQ